MKVRFRPAQWDSFLERFAYEHVVSPDHFLVKLRGLIDWERFTPRFVRLYAGEGKRGPMAYQPVLVFKMLLLVIPNLTDPAPCAILPIKLGACPRGPLAPDALLDIAAHLRRLCLASVARDLAGAS